MIRPVLAVALVLTSSAAIALDAVSLTIESIAAHGWKFEGIRLALTGPPKSPRKLTLTIDRLSLPKPFNDLGLITIQCASFTWERRELICTQGRAKARSKQWQSPAANFSFHIGHEQNTFALTDLQLAGGAISINAVQRDKRWRIQATAKAVQAAAIQKLLPQPALLEARDGRVTLTLKASGSDALMDNFTVTAHMDGLTAQTPDGRFAAEKAGLESRLDAQNHQSLWQWQSRSRVTGGAFYSEPVYLEAGGQPMVLEAQGNWNGMNKRAEIMSILYQHGTALTVSGSAIALYDKKPSLETADLSLRSDDLQTLSAIYLKPFLEQTAGAGLTLAGTMNADFSINRDALTAVTATVNKLAVNDTAGRVTIEGGVGTINWSGDEAFNQPSTFAWRKLQIHSLPIGASRFLFLGRAGTFKLLEKTRLPSLGGFVTLNQLGWRAKKQQEPEIYFSGSLDTLSLEQVSKALNWTPLSGTISGDIPRVEYRDQTLRLGGELNIKVFDGDINITQLAASGLLTGQPRFYSDLEINNLDLDQLTGKFKFGGITGRLSGFVRRLHLENWRPISFYAWLGTPDDDGSRHRISQKAVKNIASIGGGGASDILSRSFLSIFETFGYDKIGLGCYLHDGVCQLMGVKATPQGYAIITGGGLPRIDVIGYNPRLDWNVLMERLSRISKSDEVIIK